ncbi:hypothetical protein N7495_002878 [Penicillium taxi]|uniref:uncharacterized protein n=1 Tax=Penicillium taxi TaxID=168475 RepID=UPI0025453ACB|nr:uncharacterized protein N7495_002878 [Penicillium taxi]KAJ5902350.1 hypothetical protein N7495_002878 [Penicillium taxi]
MTARLSSREELLTRFIVSNVARTSLATRRLNMDSPIVWMSAPTIRSVKLFITLSIFPTLYDAHYAGEFALITGGGQNNDNNNRLRLDVARDIGSHGHADREVNTLPAIRNNWRMFFSYCRF